MKIILLNTTFVIAMLLFSSCSKDDDEQSFDFTGTWKLTQYSSTTSESSGEIVIEPKNLKEGDECFIESYITITSDHKATISFDKEVSSELQKIEATQNKYEQLISCKEINSNNSYTWETGDYEEINPDGSVTKGISSDQFPSFRLLDDNNELVFSGFLGLGGYLLFTTPLNLLDSKKEIQVDSETYEIIAINGLSYIKI